MSIRLLKNDDFCQGVNTKQKRAFYFTLAVLNSGTGSGTSKNPIFSFNYVQDASRRRNYKICVITLGVIPVAVAGASPHL